MGVTNTMALRAERAERAGYLQGLRYAVRQCGRRGRFMEAEEYASHLANTRKMKRLPHPADLGKATVRA